MKDAVHGVFQVNERRHIMSDQLKGWVAGKMGDVSLGAGDEVVHADDRPALGQQDVAQVLADESSTAGHERAHQEAPLCSDNFRRAHSIILPLWLHVAKRPGRLVDNA